MPDSKTSNDSTLPRPELNPLLNPILASHMGRWAEVYFTNPPEKREEAVVELLRELESKPSAEPEMLHPAAEKTPDEQTTREEDTRILDLHSQLQAAGHSNVCASCGHMNRTEQRFCGMCGTPLSAGTTPVREPVPSVKSVTSAFAEFPDFPSPAPRQVMEESASSYLPPPPPASPQPVAPLGPTRREPVWPRSGNDLPGFRVHSEPVARSSPWWLYVAVSIVILFAIMLYAGWRDSRESSAAATQAFPSSQPPASQPLSSPSSQPPTLQPPIPSSQPAPSAIQPASRPPENRPVADRPPASTTLPATADAAPLPAENGSEELVMAQKYLNGTPGGNHDNSEAAKWLWKAVGKQNMAATLILSDLYLRGDGVPHSCDQARLLLDAAARKGKTEAAERLRNLHAFGCE